MQSTFFYIKGFKALKDIDLTDGECLIFREKKEYWPAKILENYCISGERIILVLIKTKPKNLEVLILLVQCYFCIYQ